MSVSKIQFTLGQLSFTGEGEESWVSTQLDKILKAAPNIYQPPSSLGASHNAAAGGKTDSFQEKSADRNPATVPTLATFLKQHHANEKQARKFLATAKWLQLQGNDHLLTSDVTNALRSNHQKPLTNAAQCLVNAVTSGFCGRNGREFYVTPEGENRLTTKH